MKNLLNSVLFAMVVIGLLSACAQTPAPAAAQSTAADEA